MPILKCVAERNLFLTILAKFHAFSIRNCPFAQPNGALAMITQHRILSCHIACHDYSFSLLVSGRRLVPVDNVLHVGCDVTSLS
jgi:hypothetical protein